jgi:hypothetical protein
LASSSIYIGILQNLHNFTLAIFIFHFLLLQSFYFNFLFASRKNLNCFGTEKEFPQNALIIGFPLLLTFLESAVDVVVEPALLLWLPFRLLCPPFVEFDPLRVGDFGLPSCLRRCRTRGGSASSGEYWNGIDGNESSFWALGPNAI